MDCRVGREDQHPQLPEPPILQSPSSVSKTAKFSHLTAKLSITATIQTGPNLS